MTKPAKTKAAHGHKHDKITLDDFVQAIKCSDLDLYVPTTAQLNPEEVFALWKKTPPNLSKVKVFTAAIALFIDHVAKESKK